VVAYCGECGNQLSGSINFCPKCGTKIKQIFPDETVLNDLSDKVKKPRTINRNQKVSLSLGGAVLVCFGIFLAIHSGSKSHQGNPSVVTQSSASSKLSASASSQPSADTADPGAIYISHVDESYLSQYGSLYLDQSQMVVYGSLNGLRYGSGPYLKSICDGMYESAMRRFNSTGVVSVKDIQQEFSPGFAFDRIFQNLFSTPQDTVLGDSPRIACQDEFVAHAARDHASGKTYESYKD